MSFNEHAIALCVTSTLTVLHITLGGLLPRHPRQLVTWLGLPADGGFEVVDLIDGGLTVLVAMAQGCLFDLVGVEHRSLLRLHSVFALLLVLAAGAHMIANPLDEWMLAQHQLSVPPPEAAKLYRTLYWQHEYLSHRLFTFASFAMLALTALCSQAGATQASGAGWAAAVTLLVGLLHGLAVGFFVVGTRTVPIAMPFYVVVLCTWLRTKIGGGFPTLVCSHHAALSLSMAAVHAVWFIKHGFALPTFDDLSTHTTPIEAQAKADYEGNSMYTNLRQWAAFSVTVLTILLSCGFTMCLMLANPADENRAMLHAKQA